jgi:hypothetical protein
MISLNGSMTYSEKTPKGWKFICQGSDDGVNWKEIGELRGNGLPGEERVDPFAAMMSQTRKKGSPTRRRFNTFLMSPYGSDSTAPRPSFTFSFSPPANQRIFHAAFTSENPVVYHSYRISLSSHCAEKWSFSDLDFFLGEPG